MKSSILPSVSIVTNLYNPDLAIFTKSLQAIQSQDYPKDLIEHIVMDGGTTNGADKIAKKYNCAIVKRKDLQNKSQERMSLGIKMATKEIVLILEADNIIIGEKWLRQMVQPFIDDRDIASTYSMYNGYEKDMPALTKYLALIGVNDVLLYFLDKSEKMPLDMHGYNKGHVVLEKPGYFVTKFDIRHFPTTGDNGFMVRKKLIDKVNSDPKEFIHVDAFYEMVLHGHTKFAAVKNSIIHYSGGNILAQYKNRVLMKQNFYDAKRGKRKYLTFNPYSLHDVISLFLFIVFSITLVVPVIRSIKGYILLPEPAWFLHPIVCIIAVVMYTKSELAFILQKLNSHD